MKERVCLENAKHEPDNEDFVAKRHFKVNLSLEQLRGGIRNFYKYQRKHKLKLRQLELEFEWRQILRKWKQSQDKDGKQIISTEVVSGFTFTRGWELLRRPLILAVLRSLLGSSHVTQWVKDSPLPLQWLRFPLWCGFETWPQTSIWGRCRQKNNNNKKILCRVV